MKISKSALKKIIKEELLKEFAPYGGGDGGECEEYQEEIQRVAGMIGELNKSLAEQIQIYNKNKELSDPDKNERWQPLFNKVDGKWVKKTFRDSSFLLLQYELYENRMKGAARRIKRDRNDIKKLAEYLEGHINENPQCKGRTPDAEQMLDMISQIRAEMADDSGVADAIGDALKGL